MNYNTLTVFFLTSVNVCIFLFTGAEYCSMTFIVTINLIYFIRLILMVDPERITIRQ